MENFKTEQSAAGTSAKPWWKYVGVIGGVVVLLSAYFCWTYLWSPEAKEKQAQEEKYNKFQAGINQFETAMREDTYGGKTPEETLQMFIAALEKGDIDLASKYFMLETDDKSPDYLTRRKWESALISTTKSGGTSLVVKTLKTAIPDPEEATYSGDFKFYVQGSAYINLELNKYSNIWKIESL